MMILMQNWARIMSWDNKGAMCTLPWIFARNTGLVPRWHISLMALLMYHGCSCHLYWVCVLLLPSILCTILSTRLSSSVIHGVMYLSIECWQFLTWIQVCSTAIPDFGASYPFGQFVNVNVHAECTASFFVLNIRMMMVTTKSLRIPYDQYSFQVVFSQQKVFWTMPCQLPGSFQLTNSRNMLPYLWVQWHFIWQFWSGCSFNHSIHVDCGIHTIFPGMIAAMHDVCSHHSLCFH